MLYNVTVMLSATKKKCKRKKMDTVQNNADAVRVVSISMPGSMLHPQGKFLYYNSGNNSS